MKLSSDNVTQNIQNIQNMQNMQNVNNQSQISNASSPSGVHQNLASGKSQLKSSPTGVKPYLEAVEQYKKLCLKTTLGPNNNFLTALKQEGLSLFLENFSLKEIAITNKIIGSHFYFKQLVLAPSDTNSKLKN